MSQAENAAATSLKPKRPYRKGNPLSLSERQRNSVQKKRSTHKELRVFIPAELKEDFQLMCENKGVTQAEVVERLLRSELHKK